MIRQTGRTICFHVDCPDADEVQLAGDFNHWTIPGVAMTQTRPGRWEASVDLPPGSQRIGYFAMRWRHEQRSPGGKRSPRRHVQIVDQTWLSEYEVVNVGECR